MTLWRTAIYHRNVRTRADVKPFHQPPEHPSSPDASADPAARAASLRRVLLAVPVYNELRHVRPMLDRIADLPVSRLFIDDGSSDGTDAVLRQAADDGEVFHLRHEHNRGYGASLIDAFNYAASTGHDWVITMDCDEQHDPAGVPTFLEEIARDDADLISGSRYLRPTTPTTPTTATTATTPMPRRQPRIPTDSATASVAPSAASDADDSTFDDDLPPPERRAVNLIVTAIINRIFRVQLTDTFCGFKAHRVAPTVALALDEPGYAFPLQLWPRAFAAGLRVREIPVRRIYHDPNRSFGHDARVGMLDDARTRLRHYLCVLREEVCRLGLGDARDTIGELLEREDAAWSDDFAELPEYLRHELRQSIRKSLLVPCP